MADLILTRPTQQTKASGVAGLLGLFAGLCALFAACVTLSDWHVENTQARWPLVSAAVERADVFAVTRGPKDGSRTEWKLRVHVRYEADGEALTATLTSRTAYSEEDAARLQSWAAQHRKGSHIDIRYDPSQHDRAELASAEVSSVASRTRTDLILFAVAAIACAGLISLARFLRAREARAAPVADDPQRRELAFGLLFAAIGFMITGFALYGAAHADPFTADRLMAVPAGLMFVVAGILVALPPQYGKWRNLLAALVVTCFALTFDWVAFGPGERRFTGSLGGIGFIPSEMMGRAFFGIFAVVLDICAIAMWVGQWRQMFAPDASAISPGDSTA
jgi:Protein of unknown function (DUF3592)